MASLNSIALEIALGKYLNEQHGQKPAPLNSRHTMEDAPDHAALSCWDLGGGGKSDSLKETRLRFAMASSAGRRHSGTKFFRCQLWTVVAGIPAFSATTA